MKVKHSIVCVTYNQEQYIEQCLMSLLNDNVKPFEIIISDDCSTDNTVEIIKKISKLYPGIINLKVNESNLGVFDNFNSIIKLPQGDMVHYLSGDDWIKPGMLERMNEEIARQGIDPQKESFIIAPDIIIYEPNGKEYISKNDRRYSNFPFKGLLREAFSTRLVGFSYALYKNTSLYNNNLGLWADRLHELKLISHVDKVYFIDEAYPVYRAKVGISSKEKSINLIKSYLKVIDKIHEELSDKLTSQDLLFLNYLKYREKSKLYSRISDILIFFLYFLLNLFNGAKFADLKIILLSFIRSKF